MSYRPPRRPQFFYTTAPLPCPYLAGRTERKVVTEITGPDADSLHDRLSRAGFRRSHNIAYAPVCPSCQACIPIRIPVATFQQDRTQRKIWRANLMLEGFEVPARATAEQFQLFQRYQSARHGDGDMATMSFYDYRAMVEDTPIETFIIEFRDPDDRMVRPAVCVSRLLGAGEPQDGLQVALPSGRGIGGWLVANAHRCRYRGRRSGAARGPGAGERELEQVELACAHTTCSSY
jgi:arginyl-tRNA--protein-N-Asp/Glu arginylyltransferase